jgi:replication factor C subunit 3/5
MTDSGDMMEVEAPAKPVAPPMNGPGSIAQLTSPWVEKYRPESLGDVIAHHDIVATLNRFVDQVHFSPAAVRICAAGLI